MSVVHVLSAVSVVHVLSAASVVHVLTSTTREEQSIKRRRLTSYNIEKWCVSVGGYAPFIYTIPILMLLLIFLLIWLILIIISPTFKK